ARWEQRADDVTVFADSVSLAAAHFCAALGAACATRGPGVASGPIRTPAAVAAATTRTKPTRVLAFIGASPVSRRDTRTRARLDARDFVAPAWFSSVPVLQSAESRTGAPSVMMRSASDQCAGMQSACGAQLPTMTGTGHWNSW